jgi:quercetin dioxygenase-like cupin family protein
MKDRRWTVGTAIAIALLAVTLGVPASRAQAPGFKRVELQKHDLSAAGYEVVMARAEFQPGGAVPRHTHPGEEISYVLAGEVVAELDGKPPVTYKTGDSFVIPAGTVHAARNGGKGNATVLATYIVEKGKPLATPVK